MLVRSLWLRVIIAVFFLLFCAEIAFSQTPTLASISPTAVAPGMQVTFTGSGFGATAGGVYFGNGAYGTVVSWSDTQVVATVPGPGSGLAPGNVDVCQSGVCSNQVAFTVLPPVLTSISPTAIAPGMQVTFTGSGFGVARGSGGIYFGNGAYGTVVSWSDTQIVATAPGPGSGLLPGNVDIYQDGVYSNQVAFTVVPSVLTSMSPTAISPGMQVTFTGSGFGATQGQGCVYFGNGAYGTVVSWSDTQIVATVPSARLTPGNVDIYQDGVYSNQVAFTVVPSVLTSISPTAVAPGMQVTFTGSGFGATQGQGGLYFGNGAYGTVVSWSDTQIVATVPSSRLTPGNVAIYQNGVYSNTVAFTVVPPVLTSISPTAVAPGMQVTFTGSGFGATQGQGCVYFGNGAYGTVVSWSDTQIVATVPSSRLTPGNVAIYQNGVYSNTVAFTVVPPVLTSISPTAVAPGMQITFTGSGFGATQGQGCVYFGNGAYGTVVSWSDTQIVATVPGSRLTPGNVAIYQNGVYSNDVAFTVVPPPSVTALLPTSGSIGTSITITGTSFGATQGASTVSFNGTISTPTSWSDTSITVPVPSGATTGPVVVTVDGLATNSVSFVVLAPSGLNTSRYWHNAILLNNGKVLIAGGINCPTSGTCAYLNSAELYDPATGAFSTTGSMSTARSAPAVLLSNGKVLIAGGSTCDSSGNCSSLSSVELYDPSSGAFSNAGNMNSSRQEQTLTLLQNGQVLIAGGRTCLGTSCRALNTAEIYDPVSGSFADTTSLNFARFDAAAVALSSGQVLIVGGFDGTNFPAAAELYDPSAGTFTTTGTLNTPRSQISATLLNEGKVLVVDGSTCGQPGCPTNSVELYDPTTGTFSYTAATNTPRMAHTATLLTNGEALVAGGYSVCSPACTADSTTELYNPSSGTFNPGGSLSAARAEQSATLLPNGNVLIAGGINAGITLSSEDIYQPSDLTPPNLVSISVTPANAAIPIGSSQPMTATGTFSDGTTETLNSTFWSSSTSSILISAGSGPAQAYAQSPGAATITASVGNINGSTTVNAVTLMSISISPANPSVAIRSSQQLTAIGTYSDGSAKDVTAVSTWNSSDNTILLIGNMPSVKGIGIGASPGTATVTATLGSMTGTVTVAVTPAVGPPTPPSIASISPTAGTVGTQVVITGAGFGSTQGSGTVWLGTSPASVVSWSDNQVVATVVMGASSGSAQIQQNGLWSNSIAFTISAPVISGITPTNGLAGTQVTISGSGFGAMQGSGQVWLGTAPGQVQSWSDSQVIATVSAGSASGVAQVLQNGVLSNSVEFDLNTPQIVNITPASGGPGTAVTITGSGFGPSQGSGNVWLGSTWGAVMSWSDSQITATVASNSMNGTVSVTQSGYWSNAVPFTVPVSYSVTGVLLIPGQVSMVVGDTRTLQAQNESGAVLTGLAWTSSDPTVASLSTDDPPVITALAPGHTTISAGDGSADLMVYPGSSLPLGTIQWSNPGDGSGVAYIVPAVPSESGVADVFAFQGDGTVAAIKSDGITAWTANLNGANPVPDFQGGLVLATPQSIMKLDGTTGVPYPAFIAATQNDSLSAPAIHTDGTIFTVDTANNSASVIGIDPTTGKPKFTVQLEQSNSTATCTGNDCGSDYNYSSAPIILTSPMIAGDGYAYVAYEYSTISQVSQENGAGYLFTTLYGTVSCPLSQSLNWNGDSKAHLMLLRVGSDGSSSKIDLKDWESRLQENFSGTWSSTSCGARISSSQAVASTGSFPVNLSVQPPITNSDMGILLSWEEQTDCGWCNYAEPSPPPDQVGYDLATTSGDAVATLETVNIPGQTNAITPILQAQDGSFFGTVTTNVGNEMVRFDQSGNLLAVRAGDYQPAIATADGGLIATTSSGSAVTMDANLNVTGTLGNLPIQSWSANNYQLGSVDLIAGLVNLINSNNLWGMIGGNPSHNGTAFSQCCTPSLDLAFGTASASMAKPSKVDVSKIYSFNGFSCKKTPTQIISDMETNFGNFANYNGPFGLMDVASATVSFSGTVSLGATIQIHNVNTFPVPQSQYDPNPPHESTQEFNVAVQVAQVTSNSFTFTTLPGHVLYPATIIFTGTSSGTGQLNFSINVNGNFANLEAEIGYYAGGSSLENHIWNHVLQQVQADCRQ